MRKSPFNEKLFGETSWGNGFSSTVTEAGASLCPRDAAVPLALRKSGSPAGTGTGNITHY